MKVKLGCMTRPYGKHSVDRALEGIARAGYRYTAFLGSHPDSAAYDLEKPIDDFRALKRKMESHGLKAVTAWGGNPVQYGAEGMRKHVERAHELGLEYLIISSPYVPSSKEQLSPDQLLKVFMDAVQPALPEAEAAGVRLDVKPHMGYYGTGKGLADLATRMNSPAFGVSYDPGNIHYYEGLNSSEDLKDVASKATSVCVKDHQGDKGNNAFPTPGEGDVDWPRIFALLGEGGFSGYALIEVMQGETAEDLDAAGDRVHKRLKDWIQAAGGSVED